MHKQKNVCHMTHAWGNSLGPDQNAASDLGLHCLWLIQESFTHVNE